MDELRERGKGKERDLSGLPDRTEDGTGGTVNTPSLLRWTETQCFVTYEIYKLWFQINIFFFK